MSQSYYPHMKWWGWGKPEKTFDPDAHPGLLPYLAEQFGVDPDTLVAKNLPDLDEIAIAPAKSHEAFYQGCQKIFSPDQLSYDKSERILHAYGKSFRDLWRIRHGKLCAAPDLVVYPNTNEQVQQLVALANTHHVCVIPFGGGTNIVGAVEAIAKRDKMVVSVDMRRMNQLLDLDEYSRKATIQAGAFGPEIEQQLNAHGFTLGHLPDSFEHSTLGGWVATRSAGMQSDGYGKIEQMVLGLTMVSPIGVISTSDAPAAANGLDIKHCVIGSEGIYGIITEVTLRVRRCARVREHATYLLPTFKSGIELMHQAVEHRCLPIVTRLNDANKTALSFVYKKPETGIKGWLKQCFGWYLLHIKRFDFSECCLLLTIFEGEKSYVSSQKKQFNQLARVHGAVALGAAPGREFEKTKYDFPYLRDYLMSYGFITDVSETATSWSNMIPLYEKVMSAIDSTVRETGAMPWIGCHVSHSYETGASLYFTFGFQETSDEPLVQYSRVKHAAQETFANNGGTCSHHHAVGYEHLPWVSTDHQHSGLALHEALKAHYDPNAIMNPGKVIASKANLAHWFNKDKDD